MAKIVFKRGGLIQHRSYFRSAWDVHLVELDHLLIGRVESYWASKQQNTLLWRSLDHWYQDWRAGQPNRLAAALDLLTNCPRTIQLVKSRAEYKRVAK